MGMSAQERNHLLAEKFSLERMISNLPESCVIDRMSLEARKAEVEKKLEHYPAQSREPVQVRLTFRGKPVFGRHGIFADFGAKAISAFANAVAAVGASEATDLGARGAIPNREDYQLLITSTALGSFGFELEEAPKEEMLFPEMSQVGNAIEKTQRIMEASLDTDDNLTDAISDTDPRAIEAIHGFLQTLADHEAFCTLEFNDEVFGFSDAGQVRRSVGRLRQDNIHEEEKDFSGRFLGVLPHRRTFEFQIVNTEDIISGKVGPDIQDAGIINHVLEKVVSIRVNTKRAGSGSPKYTLLSFKENPTGE